MSGTPKKAEVQLKLNQTLALSKRFGEEKWKKTLELNEYVRKSMELACAEAEELCRSCKMIPNGVEEMIRVGKNFQDESRKLRKQANQIRARAEVQMREAQETAQRISDEIRDKFRGTYPDEKRRADACEKLAGAANRLEQEAAEILRQSTDQSKKARESFSQAKVLIEQKREEERRRELKRVAATEEIGAAKKELEHFGATFLSEWGGDAVLFEKALELLKQAEQKLREEIFDESTECSTQTIVIFRDLYDRAIENQKRVERRNIITKAIVTALKELDYDDPAVRYLPKEGEPSETNPRLGNLTIRANTSDGTGDMKLSINLDGNVELDIQKTKESDCRNRVTELKDRIASVVDFEISDWGRIDDRNPETGIVQFDEKTNSIEKELQHESEQERHEQTRHLS